jgi:hypothetical protein
MSIFKCHKKKRAKKMKFNKVHFRFRSQNLNLFNYAKQKIIKRIKLISKMRLHMLSNMIRTTKCAITIFTRKWFYTSMYPIMSC